MSDSGRALRRGRVNRFRDSGMQNERGASAARGAQAGCGLWYRRAGRGRPRPLAEPGGERGCREIFVLERVLINNKWT
jgi:hypothetical protein